MSTANKTRCTPGPWRVEHGTLVTSENKTVVAVKGELNAAQANARLISAAPDLLAACKRLVAMARNAEVQDLKMAMSAIDKAEGREE